MGAGRRVSRNKAGVATRVDVPVQGRYAQLIAGDIKIEDLDDEELARGRLKDKNGRFTGRPPNALPRVIMEGMLSELMKRGQEKWQESYLAAIEILGNIAEDPEVEASSRIKAATYIIERLAGKVPEKVVVASADPWQQIIDEIIVEDSTAKKHTAKRKQEA